MDYDDAGTYTCRARVLETGSLEERDIKLEVCTKRYINNWLLSNSQIHKQTHPFWAWSSLLVLSVSNMGHLKFIKTYNSSSLRIVGIILTYFLIWKKNWKLESVANKKHFEHSGKDQLLTLPPFWKSIKFYIFRYFWLIIGLPYVKLQI